MKKTLVRTLTTDRQALQVPDDPFDLVGATVDYQQSEILTFLHGTAKRMQYDDPVIGSNYVDMGTAWLWTAPSTALYQFSTQVSFSLTAGIVYRFSLIVYKNGVAYKGAQVNAAPVDTAVQTTAVNTIIPCTVGDTLYVECIAFSSDSSNVPTSPLGILNFINILRLWKTWQQALQIDLTLPPTGGGGFGERG